MLISSSPSRAQISTHDTWSLFSSQTLLSMLVRCSAPPPPPLHQGSTHLKKPWNDQGLKQAAVWSPPPLTAELILASELAGVATLGRLGQHSLRPLTIWNCIAVSVYLPRLRRADTVTGSHNSRCDKVVIFSGGGGGGLPLRLCHALQVWGSSSDWVVKLGLALWHNLLSVILDRLPGWAGISWGSDMPRDVTSQRSNPANWGDTVMTDVCFWAICPQRSEPEPHTHVLGHLAAPPGGRARCIILEPTLWSVASEEFISAEGI